MNYAFRLEYGADLKPSIENYCKENEIGSACVLCCVGCVTEARLRLADGETVKVFKAPYEIVSLTGTVSEEGSHLHISLADNEGNCIGGHLMEGTYINTTAEIVICSLADRYRFTRPFDPKTGYDELYIEEKE